MSVSGLLIMGAPVAHIAVIALLRYRRTHVLACLFMGVGGVLILAGTLSFAWPSDRMVAQLLAWSGFLCFGWGFARSNTVDSIAFQKALPRFPWLAGSLEVSRADTKPSGGPMLAAFLILLGLAGLYFKPEFPVAGYGTILLGTELLLAYLFYSRRTRR